MWEIDHFQRIFKGLYPFISPEMPYLFLFLCEYINGQSARESKGETLHAFPSYAEIKEKTDLKSNRLIRKLLVEMEDFGLIQIMSGRTIQQNNNYYIKAGPKDNADIERCLHYHKERVAAFEAGSETRKQNWKEKKEERERKKAEKNKSKSIEGITAEGERAVIPAAKVGTKPKEIGNDNDIVGEFEGSKPLTEREKFDRRLEARLAILDAKQRRYKLEHWDDGMAGDDVGY